MKLTKVHLERSVLLDGQALTQLAASRLKSLDVDGGFVRLETTAGRKLLVPLSNVNAMEPAEAQAPKAKAEK